jgi:hypothetical protein
VANIQVTLIVDDTTLDIVSVASTAHPVARMFADAQNLNTQGQGIQGTLVGVQRFEILRFHVHGQFRLYGHRPSCQYYELT